MSLCKSADTPAAYSAAGSVVRVLLGTKDGDKEIPADSAITSIGYLAGSPFADKANGHVHVIGDAAKVGNLRSVIWSANDLVLTL